MWIPSTRRPRSVVWADAQIILWLQPGVRPAVPVWTAAQTARYRHHNATCRLNAADHLTADTMCVLPFKAW